MGGRGTREPGGQWNESWGGKQSRELCGEVKRLREAGREGEERILGEKEGGSAQKEAKCGRKWGGLVQISDSKSTGNNRVNWGSNWGLDCSWHWSTSVLPLDLEQAEEEAHCIQLEFSKCK